MFINDAETQCGSRVPLVKNKTSCSDASVCETEPVSPSGTNSTESTAETTREEVKRKSSLRCLVSRATSRSFGKKKVPFDEEEWAEPWQDGGGRDSLKLQTVLPIQPENDGMRHDSSKQGIDTLYTPPQQEYVSQTFPLATGFPFDEDASIDMVSSWINGADDSTIATADSDAGQGGDDSSNLSSTGGTNGSIYTNGTGFSKFSGTTGQGSYPSAKAFNGIKLAQKRSNNSLSYSQSSASLSHNAPQERKMEEQSKSVATETYSKSCDTMQDPSKSFESTTVGSQDPSKSFESTVGSFDEPIDPSKKKKGSRKKGKPTITGVLSDMGVVAGEIFTDVRDSVSCVMDTTETACFGQGFGKGGEVEEASF